MRKYFPALSSEFSLPSSHRSFRGSLNPCGGGPAGVAFRITDVENGAVATGDRIREVSRDMKGSVAGRERRSIVTDLADAIITVVNDRKGIRKYSIVS